MLCLGYAMGGSVRRGFGEPSGACCSYLYHGFLYLRFLKEEEVIGAVVVSVDPKASGPADLGVVGVHWDREARSYG